MGTLSAAMDSSSLSSLPTQRGLSPVRRGHPAEAPAIAALLEGVTSRGSAKRPAKSSQNSASPMLKQLS